jgi:4-amino-4-deoxy-L-arabinose transferase-like glycosyltransferase
VTILTETDERGRRTRLLAVLLLLLGIALACAHALTKLPHADEGDIASAAASLLDRGRIAFPMAYAYGASVRDAYYIAPPFYPSALAAWFAPFGRSLESYRLFHVFWFTLLVVSWMQLTRLTTTTRVAVPIAAALLALNYDLVNLGVTRYDVTCAALNGAAMAAYLTWRGKRFLLAVFVANCCLALAALTHPLAILGLVGCLALFLVYQDWRRVRPIHVLLGLAPYVVAFGVWALIIGGNWDELRHQAQLQASSRIIDYAHPFALFAKDFTVRWLGLFAGWRADVPKLMRVKTLYLIVWAVVPYLVIRFAPTGLRAPRIAIVVYTLTGFLILPFTDNLHGQIYIIHVVAGFSALTAMACADAWERLPRLRILVLAGVAGSAAFGLAAIGFRVRQNDAGHEYVPAHAYLAGLKGDEFIIAPAEMGFGLGFAKHVRDDFTLGAIADGAMPRFIVETKERPRPMLERVPCRLGLAVHDTTTYRALPNDTPRQQYRVLERIDSGDAPPNGSTPTLQIVRNCGPKQQS